tara:strand:- start:1640 stop:1942 length:303 start_codon:yes stop_codon:yes gene_type:complete
VAKIILGLFGVFCLSGCASINERHYNLKYSNGFGSNYCPTSGVLLVSGTTAAVATAVASATVAVGVGVGVYATMKALTSSYEQDCKGPFIAEEDKAPQEN